MIRRVAFGVKEVRSELARQGRNLKETGPADWQLELRNGRPFAAHASVRGPWLTLEAAADLGPKPDLWQSLVDSNRLRPEVRYVRDALGGDVRARSDVLLHEGVDLPERVAEACSALARPADVVDTSHTSADAAVGSRLGDMLTALGRRWEERDDGSLSIGLEEARGGLCRATPGPDGSVLARVELHSGPTGSDAQRRALAVLLLTGAGLIRAVHGYAVAEEATNRVGVGVALRAGLPAEEVTHTLGALALASERFRVGVAAVASQGIAERYLAMADRRRSAR